MTGAELVDFMVDFAENPSLIVSDCIVFNGLVGQLLFESIDDFNFFKIEDDTWAGTTGDVFDLIGLEGDLDGEVLGDEGYHEVEAGFGPGIEHGSTTLVDSNVSRIDNVEGAGPPESQKSEYEENADFFKHRY